jgi:DNA (cytosine-5)-methyltransferase 1
MYKVISTFSGIGGSSQGYKQAGFNVVASVEFLDYQAHNYRLNHPNAKVYQGDIRQLDPLQILSEVGLSVGELDILDGSPPCSSFSTNGIVSKGWGKVKAYGNKKQRTDDLFFEYIRFIKAIQPKVFVAENVSGLLKGASKGMFNIFLQEFRACGYKVKAKLMNSANYGVPQSRERVIFIGVRDDLGVEPCYPIDHLPIVTVEEALKGCVIDQTENVSLTDQYRRYWENSKPGESMAEGSIRCGDGYKWFSLKKLNPNKPSSTLTAKAFHDVTHWNIPRNLYSAELKVLQSFPVNYRLEGTSRQKLCEGIGRSVPPKMMEAIAKNIKVNILERV